MTDLDARVAELEAALRAIVTAWRTHGDRGRKWIYLSIWQAEALLEDDNGERAESAARRLA